MAKVLGRPLGNAVYILPNLLTTGNLFCGFFSIIKALDGQLGWASALILLASIFDVLDGRVARLTKGTSEFGVQYDSLCDLVSFGLAPAMLMFQFGLHELGRIGWIACFIYLACGALRLARFNVQSSIGKASGDFIGLPIPMAALVVACFCALMVDMKLAHHWGYGWMNWLATFSAETGWQNGFLLFSAVFLGVMMVSNIGFRSHKHLQVRGVKPFQLLAVFVLGIGLAALWPEFFGFVLCLAYALSGPFEWLLGWKKAADEDDIFARPEDD